LRRPEPFPRPGKAYCPAISPEFFNSSSSLRFFIPAKAGIHFAFVALLSAPTAKIKMDSGFRRNDGTLPPLNPRKAS
jgi:hypothetical protein